MKPLIRNEDRYRKNWARLIQKIYEVDPLSCPKYQGRMKIISFIEDEEVIEKILKHLGPLGPFHSHILPTILAGSLFSTPGAWIAVCKRVRAWWKKFFGYQQG